MYKEMLRQGPEGVGERLGRLQKVNEIFRERKQMLAETIANEMGKPTKEAVGEVD
jgi:acyl-CoA reductase-like NAD-dependent aldehyde dehydrogenase